MQTGNSRVQKFNSAGAFQSKFGTVGPAENQFNSPEGIALDSTGNIYVVEFNNKRVQKFNSEAAFQSKFGTGGSADGQFNFPRGIAFDSAGNIFVLDTNNSRIQKFSIPCIVPGAGNMVVTTDCVLESNAIAPASVIVQNGAVMIIPSGVTLDINFASFNLTVESGSGVLIKSGGTIT